MTAKSAADFMIGWNATSAGGVVAAGSAESVAAGIGVLKRGGNAADAAIASLFVLMVTDHGDYSIGGEVPLLIYDAQKREVKALCGQGRAPLSEDAIGWYMEHGIPGGSDIKMAPVPSAVDSCITALQQYGTLTLAQVLEPTLDVLERTSLLMGSGDTGGTPVPRVTEPWRPRLAATLRKLLETEKTTKGSREAKLQAACDRFYGRHQDCNDIAEELEADYIDKGGFLRRNDLASHQTTIEEPVSVEYRGYTVFKCGPWTQGPFLCQALKLLEGFDLKSMGYLSTDYIHVVTEAIKLAMADRDAYYGDPDFVDVPLQNLLSAEYGEIRRPLIDVQTACLQALPGDPTNMRALAGQGVFRPGTGGTTTCVVADRWGNVVSATPSANVPETPRDGGRAGVTFGNRLLSFNTMQGHPNCIQAGKRPRITLTPTLVLKDGKPVMAISVAGGDLQDQVALNMLISVIDFDMLPDAAVTVPRFATSHHEDSFNPSPDRPQAFVKPGSLMLSDKIEAKVQKSLSSRGHELEILTTPIASPVMLWIDQQSGMLHAAGDPETDRHAAGLAD